MLARSRLLVLLILVVAAAGCGSDGEGDAAGGGTPAAPETNGLTATGTEPDVGETETGFEETETEPGETETSAIGGTDDDLGETETDAEATTTGPTGAVDEDDPAYRLARTVSGSAPPAALAAAYRASGTSAADVAEAFASRDDADLRDAAGEGCLDGLGGS